MDQEVISESIFPLTGLLGFVSHVRRRLLTCFLCGISVEVDFLRNFHSHEDAEMGYTEHASRVRRSFLSDG